MESFLKLEIIFQMLARAGFANARLAAKIPVERRKSPRPIFHPSSLEFCCQSLTQAGSSNARRSRGDTVDAQRLRRAAGHVVVQSHDMSGSCAGWFYMPEPM